MIATAIACFFVALLGTYLLGEIFFRWLREKRPDGYSHFSDYDLYEDIAHHLELAEALLDELQSRGTAEAEQLLAVLRAERGEG